MTTRRFVYSSASLCYIAVLPVRSPVRSRPAPLGLTSGNAAETTAADSVVTQDGNTLAS
jgi:hypothetical protein